MQSTATNINCELCNKSFSQKSARNRHVREQHLEPGLYQCKQCGIRFSKKYNFQVHKEHMHSKNLKQLKCFQCTGIFTKLAHLKRHAKLQHKTLVTDSSNIPLDINNETDAKTLAECVLNELKQLQKEIQPSEDVVFNNSEKKQELTSIGKEVVKGVTIKDGLYPLGHYVLIEAQIIERVDGVKHFICEFCSKEFKKTYNYLRHRRIHTKVRPFVCILCKKSFPTVDQLKTHCSIHKLHEKFGLFYKLYYCPKCNESFSAMHQLDKHLSSVSACKDVSFKCPHCSKSYKTLRKLMRHKHSEKDNELEMLKTMLPTPIALAKEIKFPKTKDFECNICGIYVNERILLKEHTKRHENLFKNKCAKCSCSFATQTALRIHTKFHLNITKFKCNYCNKCFQTAQSCRKHMLTHLKLLLNTNKVLQDNKDTLVLYPTFIENSKNCQIETAATTIIKSNKKSKTQVETCFASKLKYKCPKCEKSFRYNAWLKKHYKYKHTSDKPYECTNCLKKFRTNQSLKSHLLVHTADRKKLTCQVCARQYASSKSLKLHLRIHTQERPFNCNKCSKVFRTSGHLIQHQKSNHK